MATRFYLTQRVPIYTPTVNAGWNVTTGNAVWMMIRYINGDAATQPASGVTGAAAVRKLLIRQFVSQPLLPQTMNGTVTGQIRMSMSSVVSRTGQGFVYFRILNGDGTVSSEVGTLTTTDLTAGGTVNRTLIALTLSSLSITAGQRFCFDVGWNYATGVNTATTASMDIRTAANNDLPVDNTSTAGSKPWIEFSQTVIFQNISNQFF